MPRKPTKPAAPEAPPELLVPRAEAHRRLAERIERGRPFLGRAIRSFEELDAAKDDFRTWNSYNADLLKRMFSSAAIADEYSYWGGGVVHMGRDLHRELGTYYDNVKEKLRRLGSIDERLELVPEALQVAGDTHGTGATISASKVFVVHGHDTEARETMARYLERLGVEVVILHEQPNAGRTIIEKLEDHADVGFAIVLLTPDDVGAVATRADELNARARQNVILELGYFVGRLGRSRVCAIYKGSLDLPSDILGVVYVPLDASGGWRLQIAKELKAAGFDIDLNKAL